MACPAKNFMNVRVAQVSTVKDAARLISATGADPCSVAAMASKAVARAVYIESIDNRAANIIKQEMLSLGGEAAVSKDVSVFKKAVSDVAVFGTLRQLGLLTDKLSRQPFGLKLTAAAVVRTLCNYESVNFSFCCGSRKLAMGSRPLVMGILNVTPDSFSDGGKFDDPKRAVEHAFSMLEQGADFIDVGGESTRPGARPVSPKEEIRRIVPVISAITRRAKALVSVDTYKPDVARAALDAGACIVNDITGLRHGNGAMARVVNRYKAGTIIMHMQGTPRTMQKSPHYRDVAGDIIKFLNERIAFAGQNGIGAEQILVDPGIGFGKTLEHNCAILRRLAEFKVTGRPIVVGASRKSFLGAILAGAPADKRRDGSIASALAAYAGGACVLRVHDVKETVQALAVAAAIYAH